MPNTPKVLSLLTPIEPYTIVFDIDETLVYASQHRHDIPTLDKTLHIKNTRGPTRTKAYLSFRPFLVEMLMELEADFEMILYTCGTREYAREVNKAVHELFWTQYADKYYHDRVKEFKFFDHILSLQQCLYSYDTDLYIKDLKILEIGRSLSTVVIVDNNVQSFFLQLTNGIPIYDYEGDKSDTALLALTNYLKGFLGVADVREKINADFQIMTIIEERGVLNKIEL